MNRFRRRLLSAVILVLGSLALFGGCFFLCQSHNDFPLGYHPDELRKVDQLIDDTRNFRHPLLMLNTAELATRWLHTPRTPQAVMRVGRGTSAAFAGGAAALIGLAGFVTEGWAGFALLGVAAALCPAAISHSHYFKEESALIFGVGCVIFAGAVMTRARHPAALIGGAVLLGAACGVAASGKYPGAIFLAPSVVLVIVACGRRWIVMPIAVILFCAAAAGAWAGINYQAVQNWADFKDGFGSEEEHSTTDHFGLTMAQPNTFFVDVAAAEAMPHVAALAGIAPFALLLQRRRTLAGFWLMLLGGTYLAALSYSVIPFYRYALPVTLVLHVLAALAVAWLARLAIGRPVLRGVIVGLGLGVIGTAQLARCLNYDEQFGNDSRLALAKWAAAALPPGTLIAADEYTLLDGLGQGNAPRVVRRQWAADLGTVESLRRRGFAYVVTAGSSSDRFLDPHVIGADGHADHVQKRQAFYETLARDYPVVWQTRASEPMRTFANPDLTVYRLFPMRSARP